MQVTVQPLGQTHRAAAFDLVTRVFMRDSTLHRVLNVKLNEYRDYLRPSFDRMVSDDLSVVATDETGHVFGCLIATDYTKSQTGSVPDAFCPLWALALELDAQYRQTRDIYPGKIVLADMAAVDEGARGQGLYLKMRQAVEDRARANGYVWIVGELSSAATQHVVLDVLGHKSQAEVMFDDFTFQGAKPFASIKAPRSVILAEGEL